MLDQAGGGARESRGMIKWAGTCGAKGGACTRAVFCSTAAAAAAMLSVLQLHECWCRVATVLPAASPLAPIVLLLLSRAPRCERARRRPRPTQSTARRRPPPPPPVGRRPTHGRCCCCRRRERRPSWSPTRLQAGKQVQAGRVEPWGGRGPTLTPGSRHPHAANPPGSGLKSRLPDTEGM